MINIFLYQTVPFTKKSYKNNNFKIPAPTSNKKLKLRAGSYSVSDIQYFFEYIIKQHEKVANNPPIRIDVNKIENRITFKTKTGYYFEL